MNTGSLLHQFSVRFALGLWAGTVLALYAAFLFQIEPAQWAAVTVWIMFMQTPRLNYSKLIYWSAGTLSGAIFAIGLINCFNQDRFLFLTVLILWLSGCAYLANLAKSYNAYGAVLAGYTSAIVSLSAVDQPQQIFTLALERVSCIFIGMAAAVLAMTVFLPRHPHWKDTVHRLSELTREVCLRASGALQSSGPAGHSSWSKVNDHLSLLEHTLAPTTAESAESRVRASSARSAVASLCCLLAKAQSIEACFRREAVELPVALRKILGETRSVFESLSIGARDSYFTETHQALHRLQPRIESLLADDSSDDATVHFILLRLNDVLTELENVLTAWTSLQWPHRQSFVSRLREHREYSVAQTAAFRMALAMSIVSVFWVATGWPSGNQFVLFAAVVGSLLTLQEDPRNLGWRFIAGACLCAAVAFIDVFWLLQYGEGFVLLASALGIFLVPAAYFYRKPALMGGAVPSMIMFYNLVISSNQMTYDIESFLNNALGYILAMGVAFFSFHAVLPPAPPVRCSHILRRSWRDIEEMGEASDALSEQGWTSLLCDRIRLIHRFARKTDVAGHDAEARTALQVGLRRMRLQSLFVHADSTAVRSILRPILLLMTKVSSSPELVTSAIIRGRRYLREVEGEASLKKETMAELSEMETLLRTRRN